MLMCLPSMPSVQSITISEYLFVNMKIQGIFSVAGLYQASYCLKKNKPLLSQILTLVFLKLISVVMMQED